MNQTPREHNTGKINRRTFVKAGAATALTAASWARVSGANDRIGIGMIGIGLMGRIHTQNFAKQPDVSMVAICDAYDPRADLGAEIAGGNVIKCRDFRKLLDNKDIDAVVVATPDHWHALITMMACAAGKDVYVEKPLSLFVREGRWMIDVAKRYKRVVQVGVQNRSGPNFQRARKFIQDGKLGQIVAVQDTFCRNLMPGFGNPPDQQPPQELDWDMWLGPAPSAGVESQSRDLSLPVDLGLRRRADDQPGPAFARHRAVVHRGQGLQVGLQHRRADLPQGQHGDARQSGRADRLPRASRGFASIARRRRGARAWGWAGSCSTVRAA